MHRLMKTMKKVWKKHSRIGSYSNPSLQTIQQYINPTAGKPKPKQIKKSIFTNPNGFLTEKKKQKGTLHKKADEQKKNQENKDHTFTTKYKKWGVLGGGVARVVGFKRSLPVVKKEILVDVAKEGFSFY